MTKILWLSPNFNHYKARFLNRFAKRKRIDLHILVGEGEKSLGHREIEDEWEFALYRLAVSKKRFGFSFRVCFFLFKNYKSYQWIMVPREKKNILLILFCFFLRYVLFRRDPTKLFSYNHPFFDNRYKEGYEARLLRFFYKYYDKIIFYTEISRNKAVDKGLISKEKAGWANNTLDSDEIQQYYSFTYPDFDRPMILFIGRLVESKKMELLFGYFNVLKDRVAKLGLNLTLEIIGDGPMQPYVLDRSKDDENIIYYGAVNKEELLSKIFKRSTFIFVPGHSGLSINHAFLYGRPYITTEATDYNDAPEIDYIKTGRNGYILSGTFEKNVNAIFSLITDTVKLKRMCDEAYQTGKSLSIGRWCDQVCESLDIT